MAYTFEHSYYFRPYRGNSSFWLNRYGNGSIEDHQKATLYAATGAADQRLKIHQVSGGCQLLSDLNNAYGLNIYGRGAGSVCDFFRVSGNERDALIDLLTVDATNNLYRIKMINHNLYLTPASNSNGASLTWESASGADNQVWQLCTTQTSGGGSTSGKIVIPVWLSQKNHPVSWFQGNGCAVTAGIMAAAYRDRENYTVTSFDGYVTTSDGNIKLWNSNKGYTWLTKNGWSFILDTEVAKRPTDAETVAYIKSIIDTGIPPICYCPGGKGHWMLAFDYTSGSSFEDIIIIDPADGTRKSLAAGMNLSCKGTSLGITKIRKAPSKH